MPRPSGIVNCVGATSSVSSERTFIIVSRSGNGTVNAADFRSVLPADGHLRVNCA